MPIVWRFSQNRKYIDLQTAILYYTSIIRPHLEYASCIYFNASIANINALEKIQNKCLRIISQSPPRTNSNDLRNYLDIPSLMDRRKYFYLCNFYQLHYNLSPNLGNNFKPDMAQFTYSLRSQTHSNLKVPRMNKSIGQRALCYLGPKTFNSLPSEIKNIPTYQLFKSHLKKYLL